MGMAAWIIYCALGADRGAGFKTNELWIRHADGTYSDDAVGTGVADPFGRGRVATFFDLDHDRWPDLFVGNKVAAHGWPAWPECRPRPTRRRQL